MIKEILIGFIVGIVANAAGLYLYVFFFADFSFETTVQMAYKQHYLSSLITLGAILNFLPFFVFLKKKEIYRSRGVLLATLAATLLVLMLKIFN